jgi:bifunctional oligoribonuclease and PAP phosphatase NrnA
MNEQYSEVGRLINRSQKILCIAHKKPDGDTLGAVIAMSIKLKELKKDVQMACVDDLSERFMFLPESHNFIKEFDFRNYDSIFVLDAGASYMTKYEQIYPEIFKGDVPIINIDHHASNDNFGSINIVDVQSASTTMIIYRMLKYLELSINPDMATALLAGIYNDTGSLMHSNTNMEVFEICSKLSELGAKINLISKNLFKTNPISTLKIWGRVLEKAVMNDQGVTISVVTNQDLLELDAKSDELSGVVDFLNAVPGSKFTVLLNEDEKGNVKGSFRTRNDDVDLAKFAEMFGGGGHKKAAGFTMKGRLHREIRWKVIPEVPLIEGAGVNDKAAEIDKKILSKPEKMLADSLEIPMPVKSE